MRPPTTIPPPTPVPAIDAKDHLRASAGAIGRLGDREAVRVVGNPQRTPKPRFKVLLQRLADQPRGVGVLDEAGRRGDRARNADAHRRTSPGFGIRDSGFDGPLFERSDQPHDCRRALLRSRLAGVSRRERATSTLPSSAIPSIFVPPRSIPMRSATPRAYNPSHVETKVPQGVGGDRRGRGDGRVCRRATRLRAAEGAEERDDQTDPDPDGAATRRRPTGSACR